MLKAKNLLFLLALLVVPFISGCDDDDPEPENEEETITTVALTLTPTTAGSDVVVMTFTDLDADGPLPPATTQSGDLTANTTYTGAITFSDASDPTDIEDITLEISDEDDEHQVFYQTDAGLNMTFAYNDSDDDNNPIGLLTNVTTGDASSGNLTVTLRHEPNKTATGVAIDNPAPAGGETDIEVVFGVTF